MGWAKGQSGNPKGRRPEKVNAELRELAGKHTKRAIETLAAIMEDVDAPHAARVTASTAILDRGHGKPMQATEHSGNITVKLDSTDAAA